MQCCRAAVHVPPINLCNAAVHVPPIPLRSNAQQAKGKKTKTLFSSVVAINDNNNRRGMVGQHLEPLATNPPPPLPHSPPFVRTMLRGMLIRQLYGCNLDNDAFDARLDLRLRFLSEDRTGLSCGRANH